MADMDAGESKKLSCCEKEVKHDVSCIRCNKSFHYGCALKTVELYVSVDAIVCCDGQQNDPIRQNNGSNRLKVTRSPVVAAAVSPLEYDLMKRLLSEMEDKNKLIQENQILLEEKITRLSEQICGSVGEPIQMPQYSELNDVEFVLNELYERQPDGIQPSREWQLSTKPI